MHESQQNQPDYQTLKQKYLQSIHQRQQTTQLMTQHLATLQLLFNQTFQKLSQCSSQIHTFRQLLKQQSMSLEQDRSFLKQIINSSQQKLQSSVIQVDSFAPNKELCYVVKVNDKDYSTVMNQSNLFTNNNKFYIVQALGKLSKEDEFYAFMRWGRVGCQGQLALMGPMKMNQAIEKYESKIKDKLKAGYAIVEMAAPNEADKQLPQVSSNLELSPINKLAHILSSPQTYNNLLSKTGYDQKKLPITKMMNNLFIQAFDILKKVKIQLDNPNEQTQNTLSALSGNFYTLIPHNFGFCKMSTFILNTHSKVNEKIMMLGQIARARDSLMLVENVENFMKKVRHVDDANEMQKMRTQILGIPEELEGWSLCNIFQISEKKEELKRICWLEIQPSQVLIYLQNGIRQDEYMLDELLTFGRGIYVKPTIEGALEQANKANKNSVYYFAVQVSCKNCLNMEEPNPKAREQYSSDWDCIIKQQLLQSSQIVQTQICIYNPKIVAIRYLVEFAKK